MTGGWDDDDQNDWDDDQTPEARWDELLDGGLLVGDERDELERLAAKHGWIAPTFRLAAAPEGHPDRGPWWRATGGVRA